MKNTITMPATEINPTRQAAKAKRQMGQHYLKCSGSTEQIKSTLDTNAQKHDPLFKVRGIERHRLCRPGGGHTPVSY